MDLTPYRLERAELGESWDRFVANSPQGTIFSTSVFLEALDARPGVWFCRKNRELVAAVAVIETDDGSACQLHDLAVYGGVLIAPPGNKQNLAQVHSESHRIYSFLAGELPRVYRRVVIVSAPSPIDLRPFLWYRYDEAGTHYHAEIRYTSLLELPSPEFAELLDGNPLYESATKSRRQAIRYGRAAGVKTVEVSDPEIIANLYREAFSKQGKSLEVRRFEEVRAVAAALMRASMARLFVSLNPSGQLEGGALFGIHRGRATYLFGGRALEGRNDYAGTMVLWDAFSVLAKDGVSTVDLEGVNSPQRGYFKLSFGGTITPYYRVTLGHQAADC